VKGMQRISVKVGARDPRGASDAGDEDHLFHIHFQVINRPENEPIRMPWPHPGQKGVPFTPGRRYFSIALVIGRPSSASLDSLGRDGLSG